MTDVQAGEVMQEEPAEDWIDTRIRLAMAAKPVPEATSTAVKDAVRTRLAERVLSAGDLSRLAKDLLATLRGESGK